jgi:multimeric flavodoxin WrbA
MEAASNHQQKIMVLDGISHGENDRSLILDTLTDVLQKNSDQVKVFNPENLRLAHCIGCFGCWLETPGICRFKEPAYQEIFRAFMQSDIVIILSPVTFGGYSSPVKRIVERTVPVLLPYMAVYNGDIHHKPRYSKYPRLIGIGFQDKPDAAAADIFKLLVGRHAIDMHAPSYAAEVIDTNENIEKLRQTFQSILTRKDALCGGKSIKNLVPPGEAIKLNFEANRKPRALLIVGSPKTLSKSTSGVLGNFILDQLKEQKWQTESLPLKTDLETPEGEQALINAVERADLLILAFPLYVDSLPYLLTRALEVIASHRNNTQNHPLYVFAVANNGFPESYQNNVALSICRQFAKSSNLTWAGALMMGAGESIISGAPLTQKSDLGFPLTKIITALRSSADALAQGRIIPTGAIKSLAGVPIPLTPFFVWRLMFINGSTAFWQKRAAEHGIDKEKMLAQPLNNL